MDPQEHIHYAMLMRVMGYDYGVYKKQYDSNAQACKALNSLAFSNGDNIDLFNLLEILLGRDLSRNEAREKAIQYSEEHGTDKTVVMTIAGATNSKIDYSAFEKGDGRMCTLFEEIALQSFAGTLPADVDYEKELETMREEK